MRVSDGPAPSSEANNDPISRYDTSSQAASNAEDDTVKARMTEAKAKVIAALFH
jgi:hypothetical protein